MATMSSSEMTYCCPALPLGLGLMVATVLIKDDFFWFSAILVALDRLIY